VKQEQHDTLVVDSSEDEDDEEQHRLMCFQKPSLTKDSKAVSITKAVLKTFKCFHKITRGHDHEPDEEEARQAR
jgi:hypothetical protein